jgi:hypothetical protein
MTFEARRAISANHPSLPAHFPAAPLIGVVVLDEVFRRCLSGAKIVSLPAYESSNFLCPQPEQTFKICFSASDDGRGEVNFSCRVEDRVIVEGRLEVCWETK